MTLAGPDGHSSRQKRARVLLAVIGVLLIAVVTAFIFADAGSNWSVPPEAKTLVNPVPMDAPTIAAGKAVYEDRCANCHGESGDGKGREAWKYLVKPADFTDLSKMSTRTDGELFWKITVGRKPMPSFESKLSDDERWMVVNYIRTFARPSALTNSPDSHPQ